jgi:pimeloyl-ACP methyl ester carboxylesterase/uncharacterized membrane protein YvlD (DUF360 family)
MRRLRNFVLRLSIEYILFTMLLALRGISRDQQLFGVWVVAFVFTVLSVTVRRVLLILCLPFIIMTGGLFIFVVDGLILVLTAALTRLNITNFWWALAGVVVMSSANIWIERAFRALGWFRDDENGPENILTSRTPSRWLRLVLVAILLFGVVFSAAMAWQFFLLTSMLTQSITVMTTAASICFACFTFGISWLVAEGLALDRRARFSLLATVLATLVVVAPASILIHTAEPIPVKSTPQPRPDTRYWSLRTGSQIAYHVFTTEASDVERNPVIFLHGGPGRAVLDEDLAFFSSFTEEGFDVYAYDQVGTGLSGRLGIIEAYSVWRHVRDLEAIRETIRADRLVLVAHHAGAEIALRYMTQHRDRVERVVFYSPTPMWDDQQFPIEQTRTAAFPSEPLTLQDLRPTIAMAIAVYSPATAQRYASQEEITTWSDRRIDERIMVCPGAADLAPRPQSPGYNGYAEVIGRVTADRPPDPRPALRQVLIPTVLLRGECDPIDAGVVRQYEDTLAYLQVFEIEEAGSMLPLSQPEVVRSIITAFLNREDVPEL